MAVAYYNDAPQVYLEDQLESLIHAIHDMLFDMLQNMNALVNRPDPLPHLIDDKEEDAKLIYSDIRHTRIELNGIYQHMEDHVDTNPGLKKYFIYVKQFGLNRYNYFKNAVLSFADKYRPAPIFQMNPPFPAEVNELLGFFIPGQYVPKSIEQLKKIKAENFCKLIDAKVALSKLEESVKLLAEHAPQDMFNQLTLSPLKQPLIWTSNDHAESTI